MNTYPICCEKCDTELGTFETQAELPGDSMKLGLCKACTDAQFAPPAKSEEK